MPLACRLWRIGESPKLADSQRAEGERLALLPTVICSHALEPNRDGPLNAYDDTAA